MQVDKIVANAAAMSALLAADGDTVRPAKATLKLSTKSASQKRGRVKMADEHNSNRAAPKHKRVEADTKRQHSKPPNAKRQDHKPPYKVMSTKSGSAERPAAVSRPHTGKIKSSDIISNASRTPKQQKMAARLESGRFRFLNERLYTTTGADAFQWFQQQPQLFDEYHCGFRNQVQTWPRNPVDTVATDLKSLVLKRCGRSGGKKQNKRGTPFCIADMGCGDATLAADLTACPKVSGLVTVHSFDLIAHNEHVTAANIAHVPLEDGSVDCVVFCLSLMGTDCVDFLAEAHRILRDGGFLKIVEVQSRFADGVEPFIATLKSMGFSVTGRNVTDKMFVFMDFRRTGASFQRADASGRQLLLPCTYKRR